MHGQHRHNVAPTHDSRGASLWSWRAYLSPLLRCPRAGEELLVLFFKASSCRLVQILLVFFLVSCRVVSCSPLYYVFALDEMHSSAVLSLLVFFLLSRSWSWRECGERPVGTGTDGTLALRLNVCFSPLEPRTKGSRFALARLIVKYGYYIAGQSGMPYASTAVR